MKYLLNILLLCVQMKRKLIFQLDKINQSLASKVLIMRIVMKVKVIALTYRNHTLSTQESVILMSIQPFY